MVFVEFKLRIVENGDVKFLIENHKASNRLFKRLLVNNGVCLSLVLCEIAKTNSRELICHLVALNNEDNGNSIAREINSL